MLYLCATPIGNLEDITLRVLRVLSEVDAIYAEDTRHSSLLLKHYDIKKPLYSCHEHNEAARASEITERLKQGENIAYISDAGMPCVSDPGARLVRACLDEGVQFTVLPGATACVTALALSGLTSDKFAFFGFLPRSGKERKAQLASIADMEISSIIYESPNRVYDTLCELAALCDEKRRAAVVREITKMYEQSMCDYLPVLCDYYSEESPKGECVIIIEGKAKQETSIGDADEYILQCLAEGMKAKDVAKDVSEKLNIPKNDVYKRVLELKDE